MATKNKYSYFIPAIVCALVLGISVAIYAWVGELSFLYSKKNEQATTLAAQTVVSHSITSRIEKLQNQIKHDTQNAKLWFELGNEYMAESEFKKAALVYGYAERLSDFATAQLYTAQASARYYDKRQQMDKQTQDWLNKALQIEPKNPTAHMLIASDHFLSARYAQAIKHWETILDSNPPQINRASIIHSINQAKTMLKNSAKPTVNIK